MDRADHIGLGMAAVAHVALFALLSRGAMMTPDPLKLRPQAVDVELVDDIALQSMARQQNPPPAAQAPELGEPAPDAPDRSPEPDMAKAAAIDPLPVPTPKVAPRPAEKPVAKPTPKAVAEPARPKPAPPKPARGPRLGDDFLKGIADTPAPRTDAAAPSSANFGPADARSLNAEINRQLKRHWRPPSGADADRLVTELSVRLDRNGAVIGRPEVIAQRGVTDANRVQASLHAERAIQAVQRASPFQNLPPQFYDQWNWLQPLRFDARLSR